MPNFAVMFAVVLCLIQTEEAHAMTKFDQSLEDAVSTAETPEDMFPVLILCELTCDPVLAALRSAGKTDFTVVQEVNMVTTRLNAETLAKIAALEAVATIELDGEASID